MKRPAIISLGEVLWDLFPEGARFGGAPANFACHAAALGGDVTMVSAVGDDARGREAIAILDQYSIDTSLIQTLADAPTGSVAIELDANAKPTFTIHQGSAWDCLPWTPELETRIKRADAVYFGTLGQRSELSRTTIHKALTLAERAGITRVVDVNLRSPFYDQALIRESLRQASVLKLSDDELAEICAACGIALTAQAEHCLSELLVMFQLDLVVMTLGEKGALLISPDRTIEQPGIATTVRDTVGAGDSFTAAFLIGLLRGDPHEVILKDACELAAAVCSQAGAVPAPHKVTNHPLTQTP